jgi:MerR family transcriptional regulator, light-induced transcriptional regulator
MSPTRPVHQTAGATAAQPTFRSSAVARMAVMPVATLRVWEQRYQAVQPTTTPSGHRLYSPADLQRVLLLRRLTEHGHAISAISKLGSAELQALDSRHAEADAGAGVGGGVGVGTRARRPAAALRVVVVGPALATRLPRPAVARCLSHPVRVLAVFDSLSEAARAASDSRADMLIWQVPGLHASVPGELQAAKDAWHARQVAVMYRFAGADARQALAATGAVVVREPPEDEALGLWLASLEATLASRARQPTPPDAPKEPFGLAADTVAPRRFDDAALTAIAGLSPTLACECPGHVAELLMQLSSFEAYSAGCANRDPDDAQLHVYLQQVAGAARALFETALERLARHEGFVLR